MTQWATYYRITSAGGYATPWTVAYQGPDFLQARASYESLCGQLDARQGFAPGTSRDSLLYTLTDAGPVLTSWATGWP